MASKSDRASSSHLGAAAGNGSAGKLVEYEEFIEGHLRRTRGHVRSVDLASALMILATASLAYFLAAGVIDQWVVAGGLGFWGRLLLLVLYLGGACYYLAVEVLPLLVRRINPVYAAHTIERSRPTLKNALVNFLLFRADRGGLNPVVYEAIEEQAATNLARVHADTAVDRSKLIHIGYVLLAVVFVCALYTLLSPKNLLSSIGRVAMPWADIGVPTRTTISQIEPGDVEAFRGQQVTVRARVEGLKSDGRVTLIYSTADGQVVDRSVDMLLSSDGYKHSCILPSGDSALQQSLNYRIAAGDAVSKTYHIDVVAAPTIVVRAVRYKYPSYTGLIEQRVEHQGDLKAIEGTEVTIEAIANQDIDSATVDFDCDGKFDKRMQSTSQEAQATFRLSLKDDRRTPEHESYQLLFKDVRGRQNPQPVRHTIEVTRDIAPEIQFVAPKQDEIELPANGSTNLEVVASDPDFALRLVKFSAASGTKPIVDKLLLNEARTGQFVHKFLFEPKRLGLKAGDVVEYWAVAEDNKDPNPNRTETTRRRIRVVSPTRQEPSGDRLAKNDDRDRGQQGRDGEAGGQGDHPRDDAGESKSKSQEPSGTKRDAAQDRGARDDAQQQQPEQQQPGDQQGDSQSGESQGEGASGHERTSDGKRDKSRSGEGDKSQDSQAVPNDGSDDGDAFERILKHRDEQTQSPKQQPESRGKEQNKSKDNQPSSSKDQPPDAAQPQDDQGSGDQKSSKQKQDQPSREKKPARDGQSEPSAKGEQDNPSDGQESKGGQENSRQDERSKRGDQKGQKGGAGSKGQPDEGPGDQQGEQGSQGTSRGKRQPSKGDATDKDSDNSDADEGQQQSAEKSTERGKTKGKAGDQPRDAGESADDASPERGDASKADKQPGKQGKRQDKSRPNESGERPGAEDDADGANQGKQAGREDNQGQGAKSKPDPSNRGSKQPSDAKQKPDARGGDSEKSKGNSGAGQSSDDNKGSPSPSEGQQPRDKSPRSTPDDKDSKKDDEAQSPSTSQRESDSQGGDDGDRSGGGQRGGGQKANKPGTGGPGENTAADEGAGRSNEPGKGENSDRAGSHQKADGKTGQSGQDKGNGSTTAPVKGEDGKPGGDSAPQQEPGKSGSGKQAGNQGPNGQSNAQNQPQGGAPNRPQDQTWHPTPDQADEANLDYTRKATDLALEHLKDQLRKGHVDRDLLDKLGWSEADLARFVQRWEQMRKEAKASGERGAAAQKQLDDALRSLGLRPRSTSLKGNAARDDQRRGLKESRRSSPPPEFADQYKAYTQGTARGGK